MPEKTAGEPNDLPTHALKSDPEIMIIREGPTPPAGMGNTADVHWEVIHQVGPDVRPVHEVIKESLEQDQKWANARTEAGVDGDALERAMRCAARTAQELGAYEDGPLEWIDAYGGERFGADASCAATLRITTLGSATYAAELNEALANRLAEDQAAMLASVAHLMILFTSGPSSNPLTYWQSGICPRA